jgi:hypothetical protein
MNIEDDAVFFNLGIDQGKLVVRVELPGIQRVVGVELATSRFHAEYREKDLISTDCITLRQKVLYLRWICAA